MRLYPYSYEIKKEVQPVKELGKHAGHCQGCNIFFGTKEIGQECKRCGTVLSIH